MLSSPNDGQPDARHPRRVDILDSFAVHQSFGVSVPCSSAPRLGVDGFMRVRAGEEDCRSRERSERTSPRQCSGGAHAKCLCFPSELVALLKCKDIPLPRTFSTRSRRLPASTRAACSRRGGSTSTSTTVHSRASRRRAYAQYFVADRGGTSRAEGRPRRERRRKACRRRAPHRPEERGAWGSRTRGSPKTRCAASRRHPAGC